MFNYFSYKFLFINIFLLNFPITFSSLSFLYPTVATLKNGNLFAIHKTGVSICDSNYSTIIENVTIFSEENQISTPQNLSRVSISQFPDGYIVSAIIDKIYIFNLEGKLEFTSEALMDENINIFVSIDEIYNNIYYYYLAGFIYDDSIYLNYYYYNISNKANIIHSSATRLREKNNDRYYIKNKGLSCQVLEIQNE